MKKLILLLPFLLLLVSAAAQEADSIDAPNKDAVYQRPFILQGERGSLAAAVGGYVEANTNYFATDGISDGFSMEMRRFNIFLYSTLKERIRFISELEFEHGVEEIALETALLDFEFNPALIFRAGIVLVPIGYFNQNHDSPKWDFVDRPLVSTTIIPATYSDIGFGFHGTVPVGSLALTYETYLLNGLQDGVLNNTENRTFLPAGKNEGRFGQDNNGSPAAALRLAVKKRKLGEVGISSFAGYYNTFKKDGLRLDESRTAWVFAFDYNFSIGKGQMLGEAALAKIETPKDIGPVFGQTQWGFHADFIYPILNGNLFQWKNLQLSLALRLEALDYNVGAFDETGDPISDHLVSVLSGISLRFSPNTLLRANYRYRWDTDLLGNPPAKTAGFQFGFASYF
ncbi:MAG: hypothetical protein IPG32_17780 [Saprospirales bacterium]|nr:hypothetical protein [Saprospirales bacterium]